MPAGDGWLHSRLSIERHPLPSKSPYSFPSFVLRNLLFLPLKEGVGFFVTKDKQGVPKYFQLDINSYGFLIDRLCQCSFWHSVIALWCFT